MPAVDDVLKQVQDIPGWDKLSGQDKDELITKVLQKRVSEATPTGTVRLGPSREDLPATGAEPTFAQETTPTPESQAMTAPILPGTAKPLQEVLFGSPGEGKARAEEARAGREASVESTKRSGLPMAGSIIGTGIGGALGGVPGAALGDIVGTTAGYGANVALGVEPFDMRTALTQLAPSYLLNSWPAAYGFASKFAAGTNVGKRAVSEAERVLHEGGEAAKVAERETVRKNVEDYNAGIVAQDAAQKNTIDTFNAKAQADFVLQQEQRAATLARQKLDHEANVTAWEAVSAKATKDAEDQAEFIRNYNRQLREETAVSTRQAKATKAQQIDVIPQQIKTLPNVPTKDEVDQAYAGVQQVASDFGLKLDMPEVKAAQKTILERAASIENTPGGKPLAEVLRRVAAGGDNGYNLGDIQEALTLMRRHTQSLRNSTSAYASTEMHAYGELIDSMERGLDALAKSHPEVDQFQSLLAMANAKNTKYKSVEELEQWATHDWLTVSPTGLPQFDSRKALASLDSSANDRFRFWLQKTTFPELGGKSLYDITKETLTTLSQESLTLAQQADLVAQQGGPVAGRINAALPMPGKPTIPPKPLPPTPPPELPPGPYQAPAPQPGQQMTVPEPYKAQPFQGQDTRADIGNVAMTWTARLTAAFGAVMAALPGGSGYTTTAVLGTAATMGPQAIAALMGTPQGQAFLVKMIQTQGRTITPQMWGFLSAATRSAFGSPVETASAPSPSGPTAPLSTPSGASGASGAVPRSPGP